MTVLYPVCRIKVTSQRRGRIGKAYRQTVQEALDRLFADPKSIKRMTKRFNELARG